MRNRSRTTSDTISVTSGSGLLQSSGGRFTSAAEALASSTDSRFNPLFTGVTETSIGVDMMSDELTPDFFKLQKAGKLLPVNACESEFFQRRGGLSGAICRRRVDEVIPGVRYTKADVSDQRAIAPPERPIQPPPSESSQALLTEAIAKWQTQGFDVATFAAESGKTLAMVTNAINNFATYANQIFVALKYHKRGKFKSLNEVIDAFSSMWMEGRYGWRLLYYDIVGIQRALEQSSDRARQKFNVTHTESKESTSEWVQHGPLIRVRTKTTHEYELRAGVIGTYSGSGALGFDPLVTAYEVLAWTIVLDWLVSVGDIIRATSPFARGDIGACWTSTLIQSVSTLEYELTEYGDYPYMYHNSFGGQATAELTTYKRAPATPNYRPKLMSVSGLTFVDAAALAWMTKRKLLKNLMSLVRRA